MPAALLPTVSHLREWYLRYAIMMRMDSTLPAKAESGQILFLDAGDLIQSLRQRDHVPAIQRVAIELILALIDHHGDRVELCRMNLLRTRLEPVDAEKFKAEFDRLISTARSRNLFSAAAWRVGNAVRRYALYGKDIVHDVFSAGRWGTRASNAVLLNFSDSLLVSGYSNRLMQFKQAYALKFGVLVHDIIPVTHPAFVHLPGYEEKFTAWLKAIIGTSDVVFVASRYNRAELMRWTERVDMRHSAVEVLPFGSGFSTQHVQAAPGRFPALPERFVLFVSTIQIRKNHALLFQVWKTLIERHGGGAIPDLVFVGRVGWKVDGLMEQLKASNYLNGKIRVISGLSDTEVGEAYRRCLFTVFPSFCEGWGLPVAESLVHGKVCLASNGGAIPEVGGPLVTYFDPGDVEDAYKKLERAILDTEERANRTVEIQRQFEPTTWADCANAVIVAVDRMP